MIRLGVIGAGWWGKNIINTLERLEDVESVHVYDQNPDICTTFPSSKKIVFLNSYSEILEDPEIHGVCIATPPSTHFELTRQSLNCKKHVLVEKPPAFSAEEIELLGSLALQNGNVYMLDALYLFLEPIVKFKELLHSIDPDKIRFIQVYRIGDELRRDGAGIQRIQKTMFDNNTNVIDDLFFHDAALLLHLFGEMQYQSVEKKYLYNKSLCDTANINLLMNGIPAEILLSWSFTGRRRGISIYGDDFILEYDGFRSSGQVIHHILSTNEKNVFTFPQEFPLTAMLKYFINTIKDSTKNNLDSIFMKSIVSIWEKMRNA